MTTTEPNRVTPEEGMRRCIELIKVTMDDFERRFPGLLAAVEAVPMGQLYPGEPSE